MILRQIFPSLAILTLCAFSRSALAASDGTPSRPPPPSPPRVLAPLPPPTPAPSEAKPLVFSERVATPGSDPYADPSRSTVTAQCTLVQNGDVRCEKSPSFEPFKRMETERTWYGWQTILSDSAALGMAGTTPFTKSVGTALGSLGVYMLLPPLVHVLHGHGGRAERSLGLRLALPAGGALLLPLFALGYEARGGSGSRLCSGSDRDCGTTLLALAGVGAVSGLIGAMVYDAMVSYDERRVERKVTRQVSWGPSVSVEPGGAKLAIAGRF